MDTSGLNSLKFGSEIREKEFLLKENCVFLNHGSYGTVPRRVFDRRIEYCRELENHPDIWYRLSLHEYWQMSKKAICKFVNVHDSDCLVFVPNATTGINAVLKSLSYKGEIILGTNITYDAIKNTITYIADTIEGAIAKFIDIKVPVTSSQDIVQLYDDFLQKNNNVKIVVIDAITSPSSMMMPIKEIVNVCKKHGVLSIIDGAHAPGQLPLNLDDLGADFFVGNLHKWLFAPRGCAILYSAKEHIDKIHSLTTSWNMYKGFDDEFWNNGTRDHTPYVVAIDALNFFQSIGGLSVVSEYNRNLVREGRRYLVELWGTGAQEIPENMEAPYLLNVKLPPLPDYETTDESAYLLAIDILREYDIMAICISYQGVNYCRLSCQVYNTMEDYVKLGQAVKSKMAKT